MFCTIGTEMHILRLLLQVNTVQMSRITGVPQTTVSAFERETKPLPNTAIEKYVRAIYHSKTKPEEKMLLHSFDTTLALLFDCPKFYSACRNELLYYFRHLPFLFEKQPTILPSVADFVRLTFLPKEKLFDVINSDNQKENRRMLHFLVNFIVTNSEFVSPSFEALKLDNIVDFYEYISANKEFSIPSSRRRVDFYHLCFSKFLFTDNLLSTSIEITGISGSTYEVNTLSGSVVPSNALTGFNI